MRSDGRGARQQCHGDGLACASCLPSKLATREIRPPILSGEVAPRDPFLPLLIRCNESWQRRLAAGVNRSHPEAGRLCHGGGTGR